MSQDDDDDDDLQLKSLRAVWLAMPDEEPPERGLDALMAAARTKATQMSELAEGSSELPKATPSWWEKFVAGFRRPAVLALATVVVVIAGAVVFSNRGMKAAAPTSNGATPSTEDVPTERREHESLKQEAPPPPSDDNATPHLAAPQAPGGGAHEGVKESVQAPRNGWDAVVLDQVQGETATVDNQAAKDRAKQKLLDEARTAAARGDCSNARLVARQLEQQDLGYYRSRVVPDPGLADCLVEHKAAGAASDKATTTGTATTRPAE